MIVVTPPPEILTSSTLEDFFQCSKVSSFELSPANLTILSPSYTPSSIIYSDLLDLCVISSELVPLEGFDLRCTPYVSGISSKLDPKDFLE